jgi:hypothetical protein
MINVKGIEIKYNNGEILSIKSNLLTLNDVKILCDFETKEQALEYLETLDL